MSTYSPFPKPTHLISIADLSPGQITAVLDRAEELKQLRAEVYAAHTNCNTPAPLETMPLFGRSIAMIFEKPSTRTRVSLEVAAAELGARGMYLSSSELQLGRGETVADTARVLSRFVHGITARVFLHQTVETLARYASVPVMNALSDQEHPLQILADLMTIREYFGGLRGLQVTWVGDGNNVCNSLILASALMGMEMVVASPPGYEPKSKILEQAMQIGRAPRVISDPLEGAKEADVLVTDTWISMGDEAEEAERLRIFGRYQINQALVDAAGEDAIVMHCLPAHRGQEITDEVMDGPQSVVFDEAENRLHTSKAVLEWLVGGRRL
ncbi:MAG: Ornithine carbamoyltransferase [Methanosaeta sp. PtaB.Bin039]|nr:MAG: Ornithine carbamoyltransferase [Methanosaeta sp. PtaB.Bin039]HQF17462.1 ornithine carbamoyltransferase [Methanotrichaceae archaeon]HQI92044.1 ornithine carbamoyltransferase [Methanotrichaceae archaeon]